MKKLNAACLFSGGKDSSLALLKAIKQGIKIKCLLAVKSKRKNSYMYHLPNIHLTELSAKALDLPLILIESTGIKEKELIELKETLKELKEKKIINAVVSGAIKSNYQKKRINDICNELKLKSITPLWHESEEKLLNELIENNFKIIITGIAALGLTKEWLGRELNEKTIQELKKLNEKFALSLVGEGGEFETLVLDMPLFKKKIKVIKAKKEFKGTSGQLNVLKAELENKEENT